MRELVSGTDVELSVRAAEVRFDRLLGHEQRLRGLAVAEPSGDDVGDATLAGRERLETGEDGPGDGDAERAKLVARPFHERDAAAAMGPIKALTERVARGGSLAQAAQRGAELDQPGTAGTFSPTRRRRRPTHPCSRA
jgi:hypothetical protein